LSKNADLARYLVTTAPDVATSTNLAGIINRVGVFEPQEQRVWGHDPLVRWNQGPSGQHIELGISEMNLFLLLGQLGTAWDHSSQPLIPIGTVYDPFVCRGLDALIYATYSGARFIVAGTPSGVTLAPEGGAHQSTITASIGLELPGLTAIEPAFVGALDWLICDSIRRIAEGSPLDEGAYYFRLTTRPLDQAPFEKAKERLGAAVLRRQVLAGGYLLHDALPGSEREIGPSAPHVLLVASGAVMPEVLAASAELAEEGIHASIVDVTSGDRLYSAWQRTLRQGIRTATRPSFPGALRSVFPERIPIVTVHDAASHSMAWMGSALGVPCVPLGVDSFGHSGSISDLYAAHDLDSGSIVNAALAAIALWTDRV
jgi:pyruvate dehydrogenase E1 component